AGEAPAVAEVQAIHGLLLLEVGDDPTNALVALERAIELAAPPAGADKPKPGRDGEAPFLVLARGARGRCLVRLGRDAGEVQAEADALDRLGQVGKAGAAE